METVSIPKYLLDSLIHYAQHLRNTTDWRTSNAPAHVAALGSLEETLEQAMSLRDEHEKARS